MASIRITINTDGPAFHDPHVESLGPEAARILRDIADVFESNAVTPRGLRDINGKLVGTVRMID